MNNQSVFIISDFISPRLTYVCRMLFNSVLQCGFQIVLQEKEIPSNATVINYCHQTKDGAINIKPHGMLSEPNISPCEIKTGKYKGLPTLFHNHEGDIPFDLFSAIFYMLSRYEEYLPFQADNHGRFPATESVAFQLGFYKQPIVELWSKKLAEKLNVKFQERSSNTPVTIDVDYAWKYKHQGFVKTYGGMLKSLLKLRFKELQERISVCFGTMPDPYDTYSYLSGISSKNSSQIIYFVLAGNGHKHDVAYALKSKHFSSQLKKLKEKSAIGLHPSYLSSLKEGEIEKEKEWLEVVLAENITQSRQHFLMLKFPKTYNNLMRLGILNDYSMGWHDRAGFRAGISVPFQFYSLEKERATPIIIHPFVVMDRTLKDYMKFSPKEAIQELQNLKKKVKETGGQMITIWHNDSVSNHGEWEGWRTVFEESVSHD